MFMFERPNDKFSPVNREAPVFVDPDELDPEASGPRPIPKTIDDITSGVPNVPERDNWDLGERANEKEDLEREAKEYLAGQ